MRTKRIIIAVVVLLIGIRIALPYIIKDQANAYLADFSKIFFAKINGVSLSIIRGAYRAEGIEARLKSSNRNFLEVESIEVALAWRDLFSGELRADVAVNGLRLDLDEPLLEALKKQLEESLQDTKRLGDRAIPIDISRVDITNSVITASDLKQIPPNLKLKLSKINGYMSNATPTKKDPYSLVKLEGLFQESAGLSVLGELDLKTVPNEWVLSVELKDLELTQLNPVINRFVPMTFKKGQADVYAEVKGESKAIKGYVKPFLKDVDIIGNKKDFEGLKHFGLEVTGELADFLLRNQPERTLATKAPFSFANGEFNLDKSELVKTALQHGFTKELAPGLENQFKLNKDKKK